MLRAGLAVVIFMGALAAPAGAQDPVEEIWSSQEECEQVEPEYWETYRESCTLGPVTCERAGYNPTYERCWTAAGPVTIACTESAMYTSVSTSSEGCEVSAGEVDVERTCYTVSGRETCWVEAEGCRVYDGTSWAEVDEVAECAMGPEDPLDCNDYRDPYGYGSTGCSVSLGEAVVECTSYDQPYSGEPHPDGCSVEQAGETVVAVPLPAPDPTPVPVPTTLPGEPVKKVAGLIR